MDKDGGNPPPVLTFNEDAQSGTTLVMDDKDHAAKTKLLAESDFLINSSSELVKDKPYAADDIMESTQTLADGNRIVRRTQTRFYRDAAGRTRREPASDSQNSNDLLAPRTFIYDPVAKVNYILTPGKKTALKLPYRQSPSEVHLTLMDNTNDLKLVNSLAPPVLEIREDGHSAVVLHDSVEEDLGTRTIEGLSCTGKRITSTIPAGAIGNERPIVTSVENWYSKDIERMVLTITKDPRMGETTFSLQNIERGEQPASLFEPPADYKVESEKKFSLDR
jgi:hypothetical protein